MPKKPVSRSIESEKEKKEVEKFVRTPDELKQFSIAMQQLQDSYTEMNRSLDEFDGESLITTCQQNRLQANSFLTPIENDGDVRVVTGTTEGKLDSIFNSVNNQNIETNIRVFNEFDIEDFKLGDGLTKVTKRTCQVERDEDFWESVLREILVMPICYVQETNEDEWFYDRVLEQGDWEDLWQFKIPQFKKVGWLHRREPKKVLWTAEQVYPANIKLPMRLWNQQPRYFTYRTRNWDEVQSVYKNSPRLKFVQPGAPKQQNYKNIVEDSEWRFSQKLRSDEVEEIIMKSVSGDEQQIWLNGVNMLPVGCPYLGNRMKMSDMIPVGGKEIHPKFLYRRPVVSMVKVLQQMKDENFRLLFLEARQHVWKPIVTKAKTILSKDMWLPASISYGISKDEIGVLTGEQAVNRNSIEILMNEMIDKEIEKFINVSNVFQGISDGKKHTAQEIMQLMKQALIGLGQSLTGMVRGKRDATYLRLYNILENHTKAVDTRFNGITGKSEDVFKTFTIAESDLYDGKVGSEIISFIDRNLLPEENQAVIDFEEQSRKDGKPVSFTFIPVNNLLKTRYMFYVETDITEKKSGLLEAELKKKDIVDSVEFAQSVGAGVNPENATAEWSKQVRSIEAKKFFIIPNQMATSPGEMTSGDGSSQPQQKKPAGKGGPMPKVGAKQLLQEAIQK